MPSAMHDLGEKVYIPLYWWHTVLGLGANISGAFTGVHHSVTGTSPNPAYAASSWHPSSGSCG
jgi:hypothetical protein